LVDHCSYTTDLPRSAFATILIKNRTMKIKKSTFAIPADAVIIPPKPKTPAISAMTKNVSAQVSMTVSDSDFVVFLTIEIIMQGACRYR
jgi:hypothetical protein